MFFLLYQSELQESILFSHKPVIISLKGPMTEEPALK